MIAELKEMVGTGVLKVVPEAAIPLAVEAIAKNGPRQVRSAAQESLTAENDALRLSAGTSDDRCGGSAGAGRY